ncbi:hypothetical protein AcW2_006468 [Taiwanofungus camphoratus]|nr:hypothetical protein AcW2_006468 [Antrodia cinnamomea]
MVDWSSPSQLAKDSDSFSKLVCALFGVYVWEIFQTSSFEWSLLTGRRKFSWPLVRHIILPRSLTMFMLLSLEIAIWERQLKIAIPLMILCLAHWALLWRGMFVVNASYSPTSSSCVVTSTDHVFLNITFFMTMGFDLIILLFTMLALIPLRRDSGLWNLLFQDGLVYFIIAFFCNALPAIFNVIDLNGVH